MSESENKPEEPMLGPGSSEAPAPESPETAAAIDDEALDPAGKALADALKISFGVLS